MVSKNIGTVPWAKTILLNATPIIGSQMAMKFSSLLMVLSTGLGVMLIKQLHFMISKQLLLLYKDL